MHWLWIKKGNLKREVTRSKTLWNVEFWVWSVSLSNVSADWLDLLKWDWWRLLWCSGPSEVNSSKWPSTAGLTCPQTLSQPDLYNVRRQLDKHGTHTRQHELRSVNPHFYLSCVQQLSMKADYFGIYIWWRPLRSGHNLFWCISCIWYHGSAAVGFPALHAAVFRADL